MLQATCLLGIAPGTHLGTDRESLLYLVGNSPSMTIYGHGIPHWSGNTNTGQGDKYLHYSDGLLVHQI